MVARSAQRSILGIRDALSWLEIDGELICVVTDVCWDHHDDLESGVGGCKSRLRWAGGWAWYDRYKVADPIVYSSKSSLGPIIWKDKDTQTFWKLRGFLKGEYRAASYIA